ncbi:helix-turn-helix domain-containing protein [Kribbella qitaiheensis]|uniref:Helix-turn-helix domain-containing protein n=1 Tax=Kribbella qitaiheensis TaxID=1544730 RepID=A0A7G6X5D6_9ACTN|nr:helix-turn-helix domain-containing protein [Kribbella qitaiheensis]
MRFGELLLRHRRAARLTQAALAETSGISIRALRDLENGRAQGAWQHSATIVVVGQPGVGKTTLAVFAADRSQTSTPARGGGF